MLFSFTCIREFWFYIWLCLIRVDIHKLCLCNRCQNIIGQSTFHALIKFLNCIAKIGCLYTNRCRCVLLSAALLISSNEAQFTFTISVGRIPLRLESFAVLCAFYIRNRKFETKITW